MTYAERWRPEHPSEPLTYAGVEAIRSALHYYNRDSTVPRLVATIDELRTLLRGLMEANPVA